DPWLRCGARFPLAWLRPVGADTPAPLAPAQPTPPGALAVYGDPDRAPASLRSRFFFLANRPDPPLPLTTSPVQCARTVAPPGSPRLLSEEVAALPAECELCGNNEFSVYLAPASAIPRLLGEIGRCRELAFRQV